jgi:hypothetical protein
VKVYDKYSIQLLSPRRFDDDIIGTVIAFALKFRQTAYIEFSVMPLVLSWYMTVVQLVIQVVYNLGQPNQKDIADVNL